MSQHPHWTFRTLPKELANTSNWRSVDLEAFDEDERRRFLRYKSAIEAYIETGRLKSISQENNVSPLELIRQLNRCVSTMEDGNLVGWPALIRGNRLKAYNRSSRLPVGIDKEPGHFTGAFAAFLELYPNIKETLDNLILKRKGQVHEARISVNQLHAVFIGLCDEVGISKPHYPYNVKTLAKRSIARYMQHVLAANPEKSVEIRYGKTARSHMNVGRGYESTPLSLAPYDVVGLDPHKLHCYGTVRIKGPAGIQCVPIERLWIVPILEKECRVVLGYSVGIRTECSAATIENAVISAMTQWRPRDLKVPSMRYMPNAGLPSGLFPELVGRGWVTLMVDNAAVHYSKAVAERVRRRVGCFLNFGPVGRWEHRAALERLMKTLELYGFQRLPSSTGSSYRDPMRNDPVKKAVDLGIDWEELLDLIDVVLADYNAMPNEALGNRSPLSVLRDHLHADPPTFLPRRLPRANADQADLGVAVETRYVRGSRQDGRRPYVEIDRVRYTSPILANAIALIGKKLRIHIRDSNMCTVVAYHANGEELGVLTAQGKWGRIPHTREMRKKINTLRDSGELVIGPDDDPIQSLLQFYSVKSYKKTTKQRYKVSKTATQLVEAAHASDQPIPEVQPSQPHHQSVASITETRPSKLIKAPVWKTVIS